MYVFLKLYFQRTRKKGGFCISESSFFPQEEGRVHTIPSNSACLIWFEEEREQSHFQVFERKYISGIWKHMDVVRIRVLPVCSFQCYSPRANRNEFKACVGGTTSQVVGCDHEFNTIMSKVGARCSFYVCTRCKIILDHDDQRNDLILA